MKELLQTLFDTVTQHMPRDAAWIPLAALSALGLFGLLLMTRGARLAPALSALAFAALGGIGGSFVAHAFSLPTWPTMVGSGIVAFGLGLLFFRLWLAVLIAMCTVSAALSLYTARVVAPHLVNYPSWGLRTDHGEDIVLGVTLPQAGQRVAAAPSPQADLARLWQYLTETVPQLRTGVLAIVLSAGLGGFIFGLLLPRTSRVIFAATAGTFCFFVALVAILEATWPAALAELKALGPWAWVIIVAVWTLSLLFNAMDVRPRGSGRRSEPQALPAARTVSV
jgi:hypothetical protein